MGGINRGWWAACQLTETLTCPAHIPVNEIKIRLFGKYLLLTFL